MAARTSRSSQIGNPSPGQQILIKLIPHVGGGAGDDPCGDRPGHRHAPGYDDAQVVEIVLHVPFITWTNYVNEVATTP